MRASDIAHGDRRFQRRAKAARRDLANRIATLCPGIKHRPGAHRRPPLRRQPHTLACHALGHVSENPLRSRKAPGAIAARAAHLLDRPVQTGFHRRCARADVIAIQAQPSLQPQAVARAQPDGLDLLHIQQHPAQRLCGGGGNRNLVPVLAGIARTRHPAFGPVQLHRRHIHERHVRHRTAQPRQRGLGCRSLKRDQRAVGDLGHADARLQRAAHPGDIAVLAGRVDHHEQMIAPVCEHQIVLDPPGGIGEQPITLTTFAQAQHIHRHHFFKGQRHFRVASAAQDHLPHMADIEQPGGGAGVQMLLHHAHPVLHRHLVAGKGHHPGALFDMQIIKRCALQFSHGFRPRPLPARPWVWSHPASQIRARPARAMPPLSFRLRSLSLRRAPTRLSPESVQITRSLRPESFRGGCSFGTGSHPVLPSHLLRIP